MSSQQVKLFQFTDWPEDMGSAPNHGTGLIDLIGQVQKWQMNSGNKPIIVHCRYSMYFYELIKIKFGCERLS